MPLLGRSLSHTHTLNISLRYAKTPVSQLLNYGQTPAVQWVRCVTVPMSNVNALTREEEHLAGGLWVHSPLP